MPIAVALAAGALAALNPCGFPLLPAYLSLYVGADDASLPDAPTRVGQGLVVGLLITAGFVGTFAVVAVPISYAGARVTQAIPWAGLLLGVGMVILGVAATAGRQPILLRQPRVAVSRRRRPLAIVGFGAAYAICSLGCTLPVFLVVIGASLATADPAAAGAVFLAYGLGMATVLMALSVAAGLLRTGLVRNIKRVLPYTHRLAGLLLLIAGAYLTYYWSKVLWAAPEALGADPLVRMLSRFTAWVQSTAAGSGGRGLVLAAGVVVAGALAWTLWRWSGGTSGSADRDTAAPEAGGAA